MSAPSDSEVQCETQAKFPFCIPETRPPALEHAIQHILLFHVLSELGAMSTTLYGDYVANVPFWFSHCFCGLCFARYQLKISEDFCFSRKSLSEVFFCLEHHAIMDSNNNNCNSDANVCDAGEPEPIISSSNNNNSMIPPRSLFGRSEFSPKEKAQVTLKLREKLSHEFLMTRPGTFGGTQGTRTLLSHSQRTLLCAGSEFTYIESWKAIELANEIFGFNGWSCSIIDLTPDFVCLLCSLHTHTRTRCTHTHTHTLSQTCTH